MPDKTIITAATMDKSCAGRPFSDDQRDSYLGGFTAFYDDTLDVLSLILKDRSGFRDGLPPADLRSLRQDLHRLLSTEVRHEADWVSGPCHWMVLWVRRFDM
jgi:hypothetical protein